MVSVTKTRAASIPKLIDRCHEEGYIRMSKRCATAVFKGNHLTRLTYQPVPINYSTRDDRIEGPGVGLRALCGTQQPDSNIARHLPCRPPHISIAKYLLFISLVSTTTSEFQQHRPRDALLVIPKSFVVDIVHATPYALYASALLSPPTLRILGRRCDYLFTV
jgi:hypothetical protein